MTQLLSLLLISGLQSGPGDEEREEAARRAREALVERLGVSEGAIRTAEVQEVTWPDAGLGCPEEGAHHDPAPTPGHRVLLFVEGRGLYRVHVAGKRAVICKGPLRVESAPAPEPAEDAGSSTIEPGLESVIDFAKRDLAKRLSAEVEEISVLEARSVTWPDGSLGCPKPGMGYIQVPVDGVLIRLRHDSSSYDYHGGGSRKPFLCETKKPARR